MPVEHLANIRLTTVIEIEPWIGPTLDGDPPTPERGPAWKYPQAWDEYRRRCHENRGFPPSDPIFAGSSFFRASGMPDLTLLKVIEYNHFDDEEDNDEPLCKRLSALYGGFIIEHDWGYACEPECCGDLRDLCQWHSAHEMKPEDGWRPVWIGHPQVFVRDDGDRLLISEKSDELPANPIALYSVDREALREAVSGAARELEHFTATLQQVLVDLVPDKTERRAAARILSGSAVWEEDDAPE